MSLQQAVAARLADWQAEGRQRAVVCRLLAPAGTLQLADCNGAADMPAASVSKLPIVMALYAEADGAPDLIFPDVLVDALTFSDEPQMVQAFPGDMTLSPEALIALAMVSSDNPSADALFRLLGAERLAAFLSAAGCSPAARVETGFTDAEVRGEQVHRNRLSATDAARLVEQVLTRPVYAPLAERVLPNCVLNARMPALLGDAYVVGHKTGTLTPHGVVNDVGFIRLASGTLVLSFLCAGEPDVPAAARAIAEATRDVVRLVEADG